MTFKIKNLTAKNFLSVGNATQAVDFDRKDLTLVLGENLDLGGDDKSARNGTGKTSLINALSYAFYGTALSNIKKDNLINKTNNKGMLVTVEFEKNGQAYRIERGRKPGILSFYRGDTAYKAEDNDAQGDSRETQHEINRTLNMSHDMFKHIVALNTYTEPFLGLGANDQRNIIEQLLGITLLSEKAELLKEQLKLSKDLITSEEYRIAAVIAANKKIEEQVESLKRRLKIWQAKHDGDILDLQTSVDKLLTIDIEDEIKNHKLLAEYNQKKKDIADLSAAAIRGQNDLSREEKSVQKFIAEITALEAHKCHSCGQDIHDVTQENLLTAKKDLLKDHSDKILELDAYICEVNIELEAIGKLSAAPKTSYKTSDEAMHHKTTVEHLQKQLVEKLSTANPYDEQIHEMETQALAEIDYSIINQTTKVKEHQDFLLKLLTNKDSFVRKRIIDQNLTYLNARLSYYLSKIGLPHTVVFQNDLSVTIEELGRDLDFYNLSRGEMTRLILSLSLAFRDVWESLYEPVNLLFIDEIIDNGLDTSGVENAMSILKCMSRDYFKSIWLISHKDELTSRVSNILHVKKESGFTTWNNDVDE